MLLHRDVAGLAKALGQVAPCGAAFAAQGVIAMFTAAMLAGARACGAISGERERQTWDALLLTPLTTKQLIRSKVWGTVNVFRPYLLAYTVPVLVLSLLGGPAATVWTFACWAMTWVLMYFLAASGLACSVRSANSWRSWLATLLRGYGNILGALALVGLPLGLILGALLWAAICLLVWLDGGNPTTMSWLGTGLAEYAALLPCLVTGVVLFAQTEQTLMEAERQLAQMDRIAQRLRVRPVPEVAEVVSV
jgi:hypothetical protein